MSLLTLWDKLDPDDQLTIAIFSLFSQFLSLWK